MKKYFAKLFKNSKADFYKLVTKTIDKEEKMFIITANPETFSWGSKDEVVDKMLLDNKTTIIPDGISIVRAAKMLDFPIKERITGVDLAIFLLEYANKKGLKVAFLGATSEVQKLLKAKIALDYPHIKIVASGDGYKTDRDKFMNDLKKKDVDIVFVALGIPVQEKLIYEYYSQFKKGIFVGVGGSLDVISGSKKRAPKLFIKLHAEWLYRLIKEPKRIGRFYQNNIKFMFKIMKMKKNK